MTGAPAMPSSPPGLCVMISGGGRTLMNLADRIEAGSLRAEVRVVVASGACPGAERARSRGLPVLVMPGEVDAGVLSRVLRDHDAGWIVLGGYLRLLRIPAGFEGRAVNIHPALLPSFGGRGMYGLRVHRAVLEAGCKVSGCTVHLCDEAYDRGPIVAQRACEVLDGDTPETLAERVFALEREVYPWALSMLLSGRAVVDPPGSRRVRMIEG